MKKVILLGVLSMFLMYSCKSTMNNAAQRSLIGTWSLDNVSYSEKMVKAKAFGEYDAQCLKNSTWFFVNNNNTGNFSLAGGGECPSGTQNFTWYIDPQNLFILKRLNVGEKARKVDVGTTYQFQSRGNNSFSLSQVISGVGVTYHFTKISDKRLK